MVDFFILPGSSDLTVREELLAERAARQRSDRENAKLLAEKANLNKLLDESERAHTARSRAEMAALGIGRNLPRMSFREASERSSFRETTPHDNVYTGGAAGFLSPMPMSDASIIPPPTPMWGSTTPVLSQLDHDRVLSRTDRVLSRAGYHRISGAADEETPDRISPDEETSDRTSPDSETTPRVLLNLNDGSCHHLGGTGRSTPSTAEPPSPRNILSRENTGDDQGRSSSSSSLTPSQSSAGPAAPARNDLPPAHNVARSLAKFSPRPPLPPREGASRSPRVVRRSASGPDRLERRGSPSASPRFETRRPRPDHGASVSVATAAAITTSSGSSSSQHHALAQESGPATAAQAPVSTPRREEDLRPTTTPAIHTAGVVDHTQDHTAGVVERPQSRPRTAVAPCRGGGRGPLPAPEVVPDLLGTRATPVDCDEPASSEQAGSSSGASSSTTAPAVAGPPAVVLPLGGTSPSEVAPTGLVRSRIMTFETAASSARGGGAAPTPGA